MSYDPCFLHTLITTEHNWCCQKPVSTMLEFPPTYNQRYAISPPVSLLLRFNSSSTPTWKLHIIQLVQSLVSNCLVSFQSVDIVDLGILSVT